MRESSQTGAVVLLIVTAVIIVGILLFLLQIFPMTDVGSETGEDDIRIDVPNEINVPDVDPPPRTDAGGLQET